MFHSTVISTASVRFVSLCVVFFISRMLSLYYVFLPFVISARLPGFVSLYYLLSLARLPRICVTILLFPTSARMVAFTDTVLRPLLIFLSSHGTALLSPYPYRKHIYILCTLHAFPLYCTVLHAEYRKYRVKNNNFLSGIVTKTRLLPRFLL